MGRSVSVIKKSFKRYANGSHQANWICFSSVTAWLLFCFGPVLQWRYEKSTSSLKLSSMMCFKYFYSSYTITKSIIWNKLTCVIERKCILPKTKQVFQRKQQHFKGHSSADEDDRRSVDQCFYAGNILQSVPTREEPKVLLHKLHKLLATGGFELHQWANNSQHYQSSV